MTEKWPWPCLVPPLPLSPQLVWVVSPGPSAVVSTQPNGHRWLGLLCLLQSSWHGSLGRPAAPWPAASMGHSNTAITSWCFVSIGVARDEIWLSTLKYGSSCREIQQHVKCCRWAIQWHPWFPHLWPKRSRVKGGGRGGGFGWRETVQLYCTMQQSDSGLLLCQINIEVSGAPHCSSISACCLEGGKGHVTWELPLSSFILAKLALDSQDIIGLLWLYVFFCHMGEICHQTYFLTYL